MRKESTLCYIEQDNKYLMLHRVKKKNDLNKDKWIGVGGKFEPEDILSMEKARKSVCLERLKKRPGIR